MSCAICAGFFGFFRIETGLQEIHQLPGQDQETAVRKFPRADIKPACRPMDVKARIFLFAVPHVVPARLPLNTKLPVYVSTLFADRFHRESVFLRGNKKLRHFFPAPVHPANGMPRSPVGETHFQSQLTHALPRQTDASRNFGVGDAIALQHGTDQFTLSVNDGTRVQLKSALLELKPAGLAVTQGVGHGSFTQIAT